MNTAIKTGPPIVTPHIRPSKIQIITAIKTTPPTVTPQIRPTQNTNDHRNITFIVKTRFKKSLRLYNVVKIHFSENGMHVTNIKVLPRL
jgi:hypothetical protein